MISAYEWHRDIYPCHNHGKLDPLNVEIKQRVILPNISILSEEEEAVWCANPFLLLFLPSHLNVLGSSDSVSININRSITPCCQEATWLAYSLLSFAFNVRYIKSLDLMSQASNTHKAESQTFNRQIVECLQVLAKMELLRITVFDNIIVG